MVLKKQEKPHNGRSDSEAHCDGGGWGQRICPHCGGWEPLGSQEQQRVHLVELLRPTMGEALAKPKVYHPFLKLCHLWKGDFVFAITF